jgi:hypothetical protein
MKGVIAVVLVVAAAGCDGSPTARAPQDQPSTRGAPRAVGRCHDGDLRPHPRGISGAMGTAYLSVALRHLGTGTCTISGYPTVRALDGGQAAAVAIRRVPEGLDGRGPQLVTVSEQSPALLEITWAIGHSCPPRRVTTLEIRLPGSSHTFSVPGFGRMSCDPHEPAQPIDVLPLRSMPGS